MCQYGPDNDSNKDIVPNITNSTIDTIGSSIDSTDELHNSPTEVN